MRALYKKWIVACTIAEAIGIGTAAAVALALGEPTTPGAKALTLLAVVAAGAVEGLALGVLQGRLLLRVLPRMRLGQWVGVTVAIAAIGWLAGMAGPVLGGGGGGTGPSLPVVLLMAAVLGAGAGVVFGTAQWLVLRRYAREAGRWIPIHVPAWAAAMTAIFLGATLPDATWPWWAIALSAIGGGALGGALLGLVTGVVVRDLRPVLDERRWAPWRPA